MLTMQSSRVEIEVWASGASERDRFVCHYILVKLNITPAKGSMCRLNNRGPKIEP